MDINSTTSWLAYSSYVTSLSRDFANHLSECDQCDITSDKLCSSGQSLYEQVEMVEPADVVVEMKKKQTS